MMQEPSRETVAALNFKNIIDRTTTILKIILMINLLIFGN